MQNMLTPRSKDYQTRCSPVVLSSPIKPHTVCFTLVNIVHRVWTDALPRCLCKGEIGQQDWSARSQDTGRRRALLDMHCARCLTHMMSEANAVTDRCGSQTEEPSGGGRRSCATKGGQGVWLPVHRTKPLWQLPLTLLSIISTTAAVQVNTAGWLFSSSHNYFLFHMFIHTAQQRLSKVWWHLCRQANHGCVFVAFPWWNVPGMCVTILLCVSLQGPCWVRLSRPCPATARCQFSHLESRLDVHHSSAPSKHF